jgi:hypothetical protein
MNLPRDLVQFLHNLFPEKRVGPELSEDMSEDRDQEEQRRCERRNIV